MSIMTVRWVPVLLAFLAPALVTRAADAQMESSRCADCHFANQDNDPAPDHLFAWDLSAHRRNDVGCEGCHGGDPTTFESFLAHKDILNHRNPSSPVNRANLPQTCGRCHAGPYVEFQRSRHYELLQEGDRRVPTCMTCHGAVAAEFLSPRGLEKECSRCHGPGGVDPLPLKATEARLLLEGISDVRESLKAARRLIDRVDDEERKTELEYAYEQAEVPLIQARRAGHRFVFDELQSRLDVARQRTADLLGTLVNP
jgi:hypothetical protein